MHEENNYFLVDMVDVVEKELSLKLVLPGSCHILIIWYKLVQDRKYVPRLIKASDFKKNFYC